MANAETNEIIEKTIKMPRWAVVGASPKPERYSHKIVKLLKERGYDVFPVRPAVDEILGLDVSPAVSDLPDDVQVVDMVINPDKGIEIMEEIRDKGIKYVWLQPGAESDEIHAFARAHGIHAIEACVLAVLAIRRDHDINE